jgi:hypothetical protein
MSETSESLDIEKYAEQAEYVLLRTRNLRQHFLDISKKSDVNQALASLMNDNY